MHQWDDQTLIEAVKTCSDIWQVVKVIVNYRNTGSGKVVVAKISMKKMKLSKDEKRLIPYGPLKWNMITDSNEIPKPGDMLWCYDGCVTRIRALEA